ncbi:hypothetical protein ACG7TL_000247 [Trametes sanguinea]
MATSQILRCRRGTEEEITMDEVPDHVINASFTGTAVYVYNLIANTVPSVSTETNLSFSIDGTYMGQYIHIPDPYQPKIIYNVSVFSHTRLANQTHFIEIRASGSKASLILFDRIVYTYDAPPAPSPNTRNLQSSTIPPSPSSLGTDTPSSSSGVPHVARPNFPSSSNTMIRLCLTRQLPKKADCSPKEASR